MSVGAYLRDEVVGEAVALIDHFVADSMRRQATPGLALAITDRDRLLAVRNYGYANLDARLPVTDETLFEFGSIGKSFTAICFLQLAEEGHVDLHGPVTDYLPWFSVRSRFAPITLHHLLTHTSGLVGGSDFSPDQRFEVWALREVEATEPGVKARYSNVGYKILGLVLEAVTGKPYGELVQERILTPLDMRNTVPAITNEMRHRLAVGYNDGLGDRPWRPEYGFQPAPWLETNTGDGCICSTAADLATYLRMLLNRGAGPEGRILSEKSFALMTTPRTPSAPDDLYGYGIDITPKDGKPRIGHGGGMVGYISTMVGDVESGIGVIVFKNSIQGTHAIAEFALSRVINALAEEPLPDLPEPEAVDLSPYPGEYRDGEGTVVVSIEQGQLVVQRGEERLPLEPYGNPPERDEFLAGEVGWNLFPFRFLRNDDEEIAGLVHGEKWFPASSYSGPTEFDVPDEWHAYPGHYRSNNPWNPEFRVVLRQGALRLIYPSGWESLLTPDGDGFRVDDDPEGPERFVFDTIVDGQALRVSSPGSETYYRFFTP